MHDNIRAEIEWWLDVLRPSRVADLGSLDINGSVRDIYHEGVVHGFDITEGPSVDEVIKEGDIPEAHQGTFDCVVAASSFQCCTKPELFKEEVVSLLRQRGTMILTACAPSCKQTHKAGPVALDSHRWSAEQHQAFWQDKFSYLLVGQKKSPMGHEDVIVVGIKR